jgi:hypothetical protein
MAPQLPDRYELQVRLGRDGDVEEWLATDGSLDRPVLVRMLDPDADPSRRESFLAAVRSAAQAHHTHLAEVYAVGDEPQPFSVLEWHGGVSVADRLAANDAFPVEEFLPNAAGLADGLATLHATGASHGGIDPSAIGFSASHPAKLGAFGRAVAPGSPGSDTAALAAALRHAVTGTALVDIRPSQVAEGLPPAVDAVLNEGERGALDASGMAAALRAIRYQPRDTGTRPWSWGWLTVSTMLIVAAMFIAVLGRIIDDDPDSPFLYPAAPAAGAIADDGTDPDSESPTPPVDGGDGALEADAAVYDPPPGDGVERDADLGLLGDGDNSTAWRTERYFSPLRDIKSGVGVVFTLEADPGALELVASEGTRYEIGWAESVPEDVEQWEVTASGTVLNGPNLVQLPARSSGVWLLWLTDLPQVTEGEYAASVAEVRFVP